MSFRTCLSFAAWLLLLASAQAQTSISVSVRASPHICQRGNAILNIEPSHTDSLDIRWNTGEQNVKQLNNIEGGDYSVRVFIRTKKDTVFQIKDTTIYFTVARERCPLIVPKYFSPNDDGYNDFFDVANIDKYPDFELSVYNKWGQRVHHQSGVFEKWDGRWLGTPLPDATYYYMIFYSKENRKEHVKGDITILR